MTDEQSDYANRSAERVRNDALAKARVALNKIMREMSAAGRLQSGATLMAVKDEFVLILRAAAAQAGRAVFSATESHDDQSCALLERALKALQRELEAEIMSSAGS